MAVDASEQLCDLRTCDARKEHERAIQSRKEQVKRALSEIEKSTSTIVLLLFCKRKSKEHLVLLLFGNHESRSIKYSVSESMPRPARMD
jgi:hypothetical protein